MKKISALFLALCLLVSLMAGCGSPSSSDEAQASPRRRKKQPSLQPPRRKRLQRRHLRRKQKALQFWQNLQR